MPCFSYWPRAWTHDDPPLPFGAARLLARRLLSGTSASAARFLARRCAYPVNPPPPDGTGGSARKGTESGAKGLISLSEQVFSPASRRRSKQRRRSGGRGGDGGRATGEHGDNRAVAQQARPRKRGLPEPALFSGSVAQVVTGQPAGSAGIARHTARPAGWPWLNRGVREFGAARLFARRCFWLGLPTVVIRRVSERHGGRASFRAAPCRELTRPNNPRARCALGAHSPAWTRDGSRSR